MAKDEKSEEKFSKIATIPIFSNAVNFNNGDVFPAQFKIIFVQQISRKFYEKASRIY